MRARPGNFHARVIQAGAGVGLGVGVGERGGGGGGGISNYSIQSESIL
ncbi:MAG: hypothetical protein ACR2G4_01140 [Pyrinomonadaceae bacterium]